MANEQTDSARELHRKLAAELFNETWELLERAERTPDDDDRMLDAAHASRYHWGIAGTVVNRARADWQLARVNSVLGRLEAARYHAQRCLEGCVVHAIGDFDLAFAHEAVARAAALAGDHATAARHIALGEQAAAGIAEEEDRRHFLDDLASVPRPG